MGCRVWGLGPWGRRVMGCSEVQGYAWLLEFAKMLRCGGSTVAVIAELGCPAASLD